MNPALPSFTPAGTLDNVAPRYVDLAVIVPTYNEVENVVPFLERAKAAWQSVQWEVVFVDDDSPDGTAALVRQIAQVDRRVRVIQRLGRYGLASACVEGMMATSAPVIAVMDADLQHDERILPEMYRRLTHEDLDVVVATRNSLGGSKGDFAKERAALSDFGSLLGHRVLKTKITDPLSGYFIVSREFLEEVARELSGVGFKLLVDMIASAKRPVKVAEVPYKFGLRQHGESKLDLNVSLEYLYLLIEKATRGWIPARFVMFALVGGSGVAVHVSALALLYRMAEVRFVTAQASATVLAMTWNFFVNNAVTFHDKKLHGWSVLRGLFVFYAACSVGALTNLFVAQRILSLPAPWIVAGIAGVAVSSVWNYVVNSLFTWKHRSR